MSTATSIKCGKCRDHHTSVAEVRACCLGQADPFGMDEFDAEIQRREHEEDRRVAEHKAQRDSALIPAQRKPLEPQTGLPKHHTATYPGSEYGHEPHTRGYEAARSWGREKAPELVDGIYRNPQTGDIFKVYHTVHGRNVQVAKRLVMLDETYSKTVRGKVVEVKAEFVYAGIKGLSGLAPEMQLTLEEAKKYGAIYGVCIRCATTLTAEVSIERAMGPVCAGKANWAE